MKKFIICLIMLFIIVNSSFVCVNADGSTSATLTFNETSNELTVQGKIDSQKANMPLIAMLSFNGDILDVRETTAYWEDEQVAFKFEPFVFPDNAPKGEYDILISGGYIKSSRLKYNYLSQTDMLNILKGIKTNIAEEASGDLLNNIELNAGDLGVDIVSFKKLFDEAKLNFAQKFFSYTYDLPDSISTDSSDADKEKFYNAIAKFKSDYTEAMCLASFVDIINSSQLTEWLEKYEALLTLDEDNPTTSVSEANLYNYVSDLNGDSEFISKLNENKSIIEIQELKDHIYESALMTVIKNSHYTKFRQIVEEFDELFDIDYTEYNKLNNKKTDVFSNLSGVMYSGYSDLTSKIDKEVSRLLKGDDDDKSESWGSSGSSNGKSKDGTGAPAPIVLTPNQSEQKQIDSNNPENNNTVEIFNDISGVQWAKNAINYLVQNKIINGKAENRFMPDDKVTRAEFIKMLVLSLDLSADTKECSFEDVDKNDWYFETMAIAQKNSIVLGDNSNHVNPNENISRQDMAVLLYRAMKTSGSYDLIFSDKDNVSHYAVEAVGYLSAKGIINGLGNNMFGPLNNATRAQAAQIIYNFMIRSEV